MIESARAKRIELLEARAAIVAVVASFAWFFGSLWRFVSRNSVDVPCFDLWDVLNPSFFGEGLWAAFRYQPGPHRQGLGAILFAVSNELTGWNLRAPAFEIVVILLIASLLALELKLALYGSLTITDALIAPLFFRLGQGFGIVFAPYPACVALPLVLVLLACRALLVTNERARLAALAIIAFFAAYTGFSMFLPPALVAVLGLRGAVEWRGGSRAGALASARAAVVVALSAAPALIGLERRGFMRIDCPDGAPSLIDYAVYVVTMINGSFGIFRSDGVMAFGGTVLFLVPVIGIVACCVRRLVSAVRSAERAPEIVRLLVPLVLLGFSLLFSVSSSLGRICAPGAAFNSRYVAMMAPFGLGLYLGLLTWEPRGGNAQKMRTLLTALLVILTFYGAFQISTFDEQMVEQSVTGKLRWIECVRSGGSAVECNDRAQFQIHPSPDGSRIDEKLEFLRSRQLSFFAQRGDAATAK